VSQDALIERIEESPLVQSHKETVDP
jgi:hypothetical protein